jgi:hypothetical protein
MVYGVSRGRIIFFEDQLSHKKRSIPQYHSSNSKSEPFEITWNTLAPRAISATSGGV